MKNYRGNFIRNYYLQEGVLLIHVNKQKKIWFFPNLMGKYKGEVIPKTRQEAADLLKNNRWQTPFSCYTTPNKENKYHEQSTIRPTR